MDERIERASGLKSPNVEYLKNADIKNKYRLYMEQLNALLTECKVGKNDPKTHTSWLSPKHSYCIDADNEDNFFTAYCNIVALSKSDTNTPDPRYAVGLTECPQVCGPFRQDYDFRFPLEQGKKRKYTMDLVKEVIKTCQDLIRESVQLDDFNEKMLYAILLEKGGARVENGEVKDGFHLHFPHFILNNLLLNGYYRDKQISYYKEHKTFERDGINGDLTKIVDPIGRKTWLMYGSAKPDSVSGKPMETWKATKIFDGNLNEISMEECFETEHHQLHEDGKTKPVKYYLPRLLSIRMKNIPAKLIDSIKNKPKRKPARLQTKTRTIEDALADLMTIKDGDIMGMLSTDRADDYNKWMDVGWTLFNIGQGHEEALDLWVEFSKKSKKFQEGVCEREWDNMVFAGKTIASLLFMAKNDNPDKYMKWKAQNINFTLEESILGPKPTHYGIAKVFYKMYENQFVCASSKGDVWYEYKNHRWICVDNGIALKKLFPEALRSQYFDFKQRISEQAQKGDLDTDAAKRKDAKIWKIIECLEDMPFMEKLLKACQMFFYDGKFAEKIDENRDLLGFENGVYDFKLNHFRDGRPDDYITMGTGIQYRMFDNDDDEIKEMDEFLSKVFTNVKLRDYFMDFIYTCVRGCNYNKLFMIFSGGGDNAKSVTVKLLEKTVGDYKVNFPRETFLMGRGTSAGSARPDLARVRGRRIAFAKELAQNEELNIGMVKEMTGNDSFFARGLYKDGTDINPMFTLILMCNKPPKVPAGDQATWNRIRILPFESCFPKEDSKVPKTEKEQYEKKIFKRDEAFMDKLEYLVEPFIWMILQRSKGYDTHGLVEPKEVFMATEQYKTNNDVFKKFVLEKLEKVDDEKVCISPKEIHDVFKEWYADNYPAYIKDKIGKSKLQEELHPYLGNIGDKKKWYGWQLKQLDDDEVPSSGGRQRLLSPNKDKKEVKIPKDTKEKTKRKTKIVVEETNDPEEGL